MAETRYSTIRLERRGAVAHLTLDRPVRRNALTHAMMAEISQACVEMGNSQTLPERTAADTRFHLAILRASGNELLVPLGVLIESALDHLFVFTTRQISDQRQVQKLHEAIEKNIRLQRPAAARTDTEDDDRGSGRQPEAGFAHAAGGRAGGAAADGGRT